MLMRNVTDISINHNVFSRLDGNAISINGFNKSQWGYGLIENPAEAGENEVLLLQAKSVYAFGMRKAELQKTEARIRQFNASTILRSTGIGCSAWAPSTCSVCSNMVDR